MKNLKVNIPYQIVAMFGPNPCGYNENKHELRYHCPECENRRGKPDLKGKLYVNTKTFKFHCFYCEYKGVVGRKSKINYDRVYEEQKEQENDELVREIGSVINNCSDKFKLKIPIEKIFTSSSATEYLIKRGFTEKQLEYYDLRVGNLDQEFGRIVIPNEVSKLVYTDYYSARTYIDQAPKYHNPGEEKSKTVFNLFRQKEESPIIVVEGALTAIAAGFHAVATLGKTMTVDQASKIASKHPSVVYINYDYGAEEFSHRACQLMKKVLPMTPVMEVLMKDDRDAADLSREEYVACLSQAVEYKPIIEDIENFII